MKVSKQSTSRISWVDLELGAYRCCVGHLLDGRLRKIRLERCKILLKGFKKCEHRCIFFSDEKIFTIEEKFNQQNNRVHARSCYEAKEKLPRVQRGYHFLSMMVWCGVSYYGRIFTFVKVVLKRMGWYTEKWKMLFSPWELPCSMESKIGAFNKILPPLTSKTDSRLVDWNHARFHRGE